MNWGSVSIKSIHRKLTLLTQVKRHINRGGVSIKSIHRKLTLLTHVKRHMNWGSVSIKSMHRKLTLLTHVKRGGQGGHKTDGTGSQPYLGDLSINDAHTTRMVSVPEEDVKVERLQMVDSRPQEPTANKRIHIYLAEEQEILRNHYQSSLNSQPGITLVGSSPHIYGESLVDAATRLKVQVMVLGTRVLQAATMDHLELLRDQCPHLPVVLLSAAYEPDGLKALHQFTRRGTKGGAYLLKHTVDTAEQLAQVVHSVAAGHVILDPVVMVGLFDAGDAHSAFLKELTPREMEVLSWIAKGYRNHTIAGLLSLEPKTVERYANGIYSKLGVPAESKHARVQATLSYMRAVGLLSAQ